MSNRNYLTALSLILTLIYNFLGSNFAFSSTDKFFDNMITLKVGRYLKQDFYEVISDFDGNIYLNIKDILDLTELMAYTKLSKDKEHITLMMDASLFANNKARNIQKKIKELNCITIAEKLYIDKDDLGEILPLTRITWIGEKYTLEIHPDFNLPLEYRVAAQRRKKVLEQEKSSQILPLEADMFMKEDRKLIDFGMLKLRYNVIDIKEKDNARLELEYSSQLLFGDFNIRNDLYNAGNLEYVSLKYPYLLDDKSIIIGDSFIEGNDIIRYDSKIRGISISQHQYSVQRSGREVSIRGIAPNNSTVEVYQNGRVADYKNMEAGEYDFTLQMRTQKDSFKIKIYDRNGVFLEEKNINVIEGNGFLTQGEWDYNFFFGQNPDAENTDWDDLKFGFSYGFNNTTTYSFDYYNSKNDDKVYKYIKHRMGFRFSNFVTPLLINVSYYDALEDSNKNYIAEMETELFSHQLYYTYEDYTGQLADDERKDSSQSVEVNRSYSRWDYFFKLSNKHYQGSREDKYGAGLSYDITKAVRMDLDFERKILKNDDSDNREYHHISKIGFDYSRENLIYSFNVGYGENNFSRWQYKANVRKRLTSDSEYSYQFEIKYNEMDAFSLGINFEYKFGSSLKLDYDYDSKRENMHNIGANYEQVINMKKPFISNNARNPDYGYIEGTIFIDKNGNGEKETDEQPIEGVRVGIAENTVKTDKEGLFHLSNVSPYTNNKLIYDYSDTMLDPTLSINNPKAIRIIPASGKKIKTGLVPLSLIMGSISVAKMSVKKRKKFFSYVEIVVEKNGVYYASISPEYDGFFVLQDLQLGKYSLKINYFGSEKIRLEQEVIEVNVTAGEIGELYEGIDFKVLEVN